MRIAQLTKYGGLAASTRQRFGQYRPHLAALGCETVTWPLLDDDYLAALYSGNRRSFAYVFRRYVDRARKLVYSPGVDLLWVHCDVFPYLPSIFDAIAHLVKRPIVFDFDDAIFHNYDMHKSPFLRAILANKLVPILSSAEVAFCGNAYLADYARKFCRSTHIVPTVIDTDIFTQRCSSSSRGQAQIGWIGTPSTWTQYMAPMMPLLADVAARQSARIRAVGPGKAAMPHPLLDILSWTEESEVAQIQGMDIGIMPLDESPWARGKSGYKLIQYMACGLPVVASPVGVNVEIVEHGVNGFLAATEADWRSALSELLENPNLRCRMGAAGRRRVEERYSLRVWGPKVASLLCQAAVAGRK